MRSAGPCLRPFVLLVGFAGIGSGCLFDEQPPCAIRDDPCPLGQICIDRACVTDDRPADGGPDGAEPDADRPDAAPDGAAADADGLPADGAAVDAAVDGPPPDAGPICAQETCNGLDDDCDGSADEGLMPCGNIDLDRCTWRHRGHHAYLFCDRPVPEAQALDICTREYGLEMAVPDTCDESDWLWATGNLVPTPVVWENNARGRAWWLGLRLAFADDGDSIRRTDNSELPLPPGGCWATGEPDDVLLGETCVDLLYNPMTDDFGWNDDTCGLNAANPVNILCEVACDPEVDADGDGENACVDCDDRDPDANSGDGIDRCALAPADGFPP